MIDLQDNWDQAYKTKAELAVSWFQLLLAKSLQLIRDAMPDTRASVIDTGGGASTLCDSLLKLAESSKPDSQVPSAPIRSLKAGARIFREWRGALQEPIDPFVPDGLRLVVIRNIYTHTTTR